MSGAGPTRGLRNRDNRLAVFWTTIRCDRQRRPLIVLPLAAGPAGRTSPGMSNTSGTLSGPDTAQCSPQMSLSFSGRVPATCCLSGLALGMARTNPLRRHISLSLALEACRLTALKNPARFSADGGPDTTKAVRLAAWKSRRWNELLPKAGPPWPFREYRDWHQMLN